MIKPIDVNEIPGRRGSVAISDIRKFLSSDMTACEVEVHDINKDNSVYREIIKRNGLQIRVYRRDNRLFLIKGELTGA